MQFFMFFINIIKIFDSMPYKILIYGRTKLKLGSFDESIPRDKPTLPPVFGTVSRTNISCKTFKIINFSINLILSGQSEKFILRCHSSLLHC